MENRSNVVLGLNTKEAYVYLHDPPFQRRPNPSTILSRKTWSERKPAYASEIFGSVCIFIYWSSRCGYFSSLSLKQRSDAISGRVSYKTAQQFYVIRLMRYSLHIT